MTTKELSHKVSFMFSGHGHYKVTILYKGKQYTCITNNVGATDRIQSDESERFKRFMVGTLRQAYLALWDECKRKNDLR
jgi:hypothetical protein